MVNYDYISEGKKKQTTAGGASKDPGFTSVLA